MTAVALLIVLAAGPSDVVYPAQDIALRFDHGAHLDTGALDCTDCHPAAATSLRAEDLLLPTKEEACAPCHDVRAPERCADCHPGPDPPRGATLPPARLHLSHRRHTEAGVACEDCHPGVPQAALAGREHLPRERDCVACHEARDVSVRCSTCHPAGPDGRLRTWFPPTPLDEPDQVPPPGRADARAASARPFLSGRLVPRGARGDAHDEDWHRTHGPAAGADPSLCTTCHSEAECRTCHGGDLRPMRLHPDDWVSVHGLAARGRDLDCQSCHRLQTFCRDCHRRTAVVSRGEDAAFAFPGGLDFHPPGWTAFRGSGGPPGPTHHSYEARRDLSTCASCHSEATCVRCHAADGFGPSPHPPGFAAACDRLRARNPAPCATCHGESFQCP